MSKTIIVNVVGIKKVSQQVRREFVREMREIFFNPVAQTNEKEHRDENTKEIEQSLFVIEFSLFRFSRCFCATGLQASARSNTSRFLFWTLDFAEVNLKNDRT